MAVFQQPYNYTGQIPQSTVAPIPQQPELFSCEFVSSIEEAYGKNVGSYMLRDEPVMCKKSIDQTGAVRFEVFDLVKREPVQNEGNYVTRDEIATIVAETVRKEMKRNRKENNNG